MALTIDTITNATQADLKRADHASWAIKSLAKTAIDLDRNIHRIRGCANASIELDPAERGQLETLAGAATSTEASEVAAVAAVADDEEQA